MKNVTYQGFLFRAGNSWIKILSIINSSIQLQDLFKAKFFKNRYGPSTAAAGAAMVNIFFILIQSV